MAVNLAVILLFSIAAIRLSASSFSEDDEIYSWNLWAIQHYEGKEVDLRFTLAPYPQLFSYWIAALYHAMGSTVIHSIPRFFLAIPALIVGLVVAKLIKVESWRFAIITILVLFSVIGPVIPWYSKGLADPLMTASVALSGYFLIQYYKNPKNTSSLIISVACGAIAAMTKQAGIIWIFSLVFLVGYGCLYRQWPRQALFYMAIGFLAALVWPVLIAPGFMNNQGVITASLGERSYVQQLIFAANKYLIDKPELLILFLSTLYFGWKDKFLRMVILFAVIPCLLIWFIFGGYHIRLGAHVLALAGIILIFALHSRNLQNISIKQNHRPDVSNPMPQLGVVATTVAILLFYIALLGFGIQALAAKSGTDLGDGAKTTLRVQFGKASDGIIDKILADKSRVWVTSNYTYGPFYGRVPAGLPDYSQTSYELKNVKKDILNFRAEYAVYSGGVPYGPASELLKLLAGKCPEAFIPILTPPNQKGFILYQVVLEKLALDSCN